MPSSPNLGDCAAFVWDINRSGLIEKGRLDQLLVQFQREYPGRGPAELAGYLIHTGDMTEFQADRLLNGNAQDLVLNNFVLSDALGQGSMGTVFKARSKADNGWYALKLLPRRSMWNVRIARRLIRAFELNRHPSVVAFVDVGTAGASHYLAWELAEGESLEQRVKRQGPLPPGIVALYGLHVCEGLQVLEKQGVVHGLIKPSNLLITAEHHARILDYGIGALIAETKEESLVDTMSTANTVTTGLDCRSPETILDPTLRTASGDQYSLGCVLYYCLTGRFPFQDMSPVQKMMAHQTQEPPAIKEVAPWVPRGLVEVISRLMAKEPEGRFAGPEEVAEALRPFAVDPSKADELLATPFGPGSQAEIVAAPASESANGVPEEEAAVDDAEVLEGDAPPDLADGEPAYSQVASEAEYEQAAAEPDAFVETLPSPDDELAALPRRAASAPAARGKASFMVRALAGLFGFLVGAALVGGALYVLQSQGLLPTPR